MFMTKFEKDYPKAFITPKHILSYNFVLFIIWTVDVQSNCRRIDRIF